MSREHGSDKDPDTGSAADQRATDGGDLVLAALDFIRGGVSPDVGSPEPTPLASQKARLEEWAAGLGLLLDQDDLPSRAVRGGQEHEIFHDQASDRYFKLTRNGVFGLSPGIELALVSSGNDARRFHLWEASPVEYLERIHLQNRLIPHLNRLEGIIVQDPEDLSIVISQPRFDIVPATVDEIDAWFANLGFQKITEAAYYRRTDNLGVFDAHEKNLLRAGEDLIPFDVIPCRPAGGFLEFINDTLAAGHRLRTVRTVSTAH